MFFTYLCQHATKAKTYFFSVVVLEEPGIRFKSQEFDIALGKRDGYHVRFDYSLAVGSSVTFYTSNSVNKKYSVIRFHSRYCSLGSMKPIPVCVR